MTIRGRIKSAVQERIGRRAIERMLGQIGRDPGLAGVGQIPVHIDLALRSQMQSEVHASAELKKAQEEIPMFVRNKAVKASLIAVALLIGAVIVFDFASPEQTPSFAQLVEASEAVAEKIESLHFVGRDSERGQLQDFEAFVRNPHFIRKQFSDGSYAVLTADRMLFYDKEKNKFACREGMPGLNMAVTQMFTKSVIVQALSAAESVSDLKIEETELSGKPVYKVTFSAPEADDICDFEVYFDKETALLFKMSVNNEEGWVGGGEIVEVNPELHDSLFSTDPPEGATVVSHEELEWNSP